MNRSSRRKFSRRSLLKTAVAATVVGAAGAAGGYWIHRRRHVSRSLGKKVIIIGIDGMDPSLSEAMMKAGRLPNLQRLRTSGGFSRLATSIPPQSPVAWANFINGAGPGSHGIFDFLHRDPQEPNRPFYSAARTLPGEGGFEIGDHRIPLDFWPFDHKPPATVLKRQGVPFWDDLDAAGIPTTFYDLPSNYPPSPSLHGNHRCLSGMGTPDMLGSYGTYQYFAEDVPPEGVDEGGGKRSRLSFRNDTANGRLVGPDNGLLKQPRPITVDFLVHRDVQANAAVLEVQGQKIVLAAGQWSRWVRFKFPMITIRLKFPMSMPLGSKNANGICRFYLQQVSPSFRLYVTPVNIDPSAPAVRISEPKGFVQDVSQRLGLFYTAGFQEDHKALSNGVFSDDEFARQAEMVLEERLALLEYALDNYDDGLLFFYFSSSDLQSHMFWWDSDQPHPTRSVAEAKKYFAHVQGLYERLDRAVGDVMDRYAGRATILVMSDHGFANFKRQFNVNSWLRENGYLGPCASVLQDGDWSVTYAYGLGINGVYLNLKGRERDGIVEPGQKADELLTELKERLEAVTDVNGERVIRAAYRTDQVYSGIATALAPDLVLGYCRGYRASWDTCLGDLSNDILTDNTSAWSADHCADPLEVPGVLFSNRAIAAEAPSLVDLAPSILAEFGLSAPSAMEGKNLLSSQS